MADQKRWFKVWGSIVGDPHFNELALEDVARWALLGAYVAVQGTRGTLEVPGLGIGLCTVLRVPDLVHAKVVLARLPNVSFEEGKTVDGGFIVTLRNWRIYQTDSTVRERMKTLRSKRRREEMRRDENKKRGEESRSRTPTHAPPKWITGTLTPADIAAKYGPTPAYHGLDVLAAAERCLNWCVEHRKPLTERRAVNWLNGDALRLAARDTPSNGGRLGATRQTAGNAEVLRRVREQYQREQHDAAE